MVKRVLLIIFFLTFFMLSKEALATFDISIQDNNNLLGFGAMETGEEKTLSEKGGYHHQINFNSNTGRTWYFKVQMVRPFTSGVYTIPQENFQWIVEELRNGQGVISANIGNPEPFSTFPVLVYASSQNDNTGTQVEMRLSYELKIPENQAAGAYTAHIRLIMVEEL